MLIFTNTMIQRKAWWKKLFTHFDDQKRIMCVETPAKIRRTERKRGYAKWLRLNTRTRATRMRNTISAWPPLTNVIVVSLFITVAREVAFVWTQWLKTRVVYVIFLVSSTMLVSQEPVLSCKSKLKMADEIQSNAGWKTTKFDAILALIRRNSKYFWK